MEDRYTTYKKLNWLLEGSFEAEKIYYNAGEDVQLVELKRFFNHESVNRNRFSYQISEQLVQADVEPKKEWVQKGNMQRDWKQEKKALTKQRPLKLISKCRKIDEDNLKLYDEILQEKKLPREVLRMLKKQKNTILESLQKLGRFEVGQQKSENDSEDGTVVRKLKAI